MSSLHSRFSAFLGKRRSGGGGLLAACRDGAYILLARPLRTERYQCYRVLQHTSQLDWCPNPRSINRHPSFSSRHTGCIIMAPFTSSLAAFAAVACVEITLVPTPWAAHARLLSPPARDSAFLGAFDDIWPPCGYMSQEARDGIQTRSSFARGAKVLVVHGRNNHPGI